VQYLQFCAVAWAACANGRLHESAVPRSEAPAAAARVVWRCQGLRNVAAICSAKVRTSLCSSLTWSGLNSQTVSAANAGWWTHCRLSKSPGHGQRYNSGTPQVLERVRGAEWSVPDSVSDLRRGVLGVGVALVAPALCLQAPTPGDPAGGLLGAALDRFGLVRDLPGDVHGWLTFGASSARAGAPAETSGAGWRAGDSGSVAVACPAADRCPGVPFPRSLAV
jgi:hypothetical protein